jgi:hypothetical protein
MSGFEHGSFAKPDAHQEPVFGMTLDEAIEYAIERAVDGGCTCNVLVHIGSHGFELLHDEHCPRLRTIGGRQ